MATRPSSGQCLLDCPEDGEPLATRRETERKETEHTMDSLNLGKREMRTVPVVIQALGIHILTNFDNSFISF